MALLTAVITWFEALDFPALSATAATSYALIAAAEIGDKSQLVCMTLASRHRASPIVWGALVAFAMLNGLAVVFGAAIAHWVPDYWVATAVAVLFAVFGFAALFQRADEEDAEVVEKSGHSIFFTTLAMIMLAEFGDKTQLAVVAYSSTADPLAVWLGATLALATTSLLGVLAGRALLQRMPLSLLHRISGVIFLLLAVLAASKAYQAFFHSPFWG